MCTTRLIGLFLASSFLFSQWCKISCGADSAFTGRQNLIDKYHTIEKDPGKAHSTVPFSIESSMSKNASTVDIYGTMKYPFDNVQNELLVPPNWCEILLPNIHVKACTYEKVKDKWLLNIYRVDEFSQTLDDAYQMKFEYRVGELHPGYFKISLTALEGPSHTKDHRFELEAIPLNEGGAFVHLRYSFRYGSLGYFLMKLFGGGKTGFSVTGKDSDGNPVYVGGLRGAVERGVVRYYFAVLADMDTFNVPAEQRFDKRIGQWYRLAAPYKKQLIEMDKEEYFASKRRDRQNQLMLQNDLDRQETGKPR